MLGIGELMTIEEAIKHCEEVAWENEQQYAKDPIQLGYIEKFYDCKKCAEEHRQLAEWLKDYKRLLAKESGVDIRCGNCKYDVTQEMCGKCYEYSRWEGDAE